MRAFAELYDEIDTTTSTNAKVAAMVRYFKSAAPADAAWATYMLSGRKLKRFLGPALLRRWLVEVAALPEWLVDESYAAVGDLAETIALLLDGGAGGAEPRTARAIPELPLADWIESRLLPLRQTDDAAKQQRIVEWWHTLPYRECFLVNKLLTGELRVGVSALLVTRALAEATGLPRVEVTRRLMGDWTPSAAFFESLAATHAPADEASKPYPFYLASPLEGDPSQLGSLADWQVEWKWDGIRGQLIRRSGESFLWSRGEELVTERFPEIVDASRALPDGTVLDGEIVAWTPGEPGDSGRIAPFAALQQRIGRKKLTSRILADIPVRFLAYDLLEQSGSDLRTAPLNDRRTALERIVTTLATPPGVIGISPRVTAADWNDLAVLRASSRERRVEGLMLKARDSVYGSGRQRGSWWKWKIDPWSFDGVLIYAHPGHGKRSNLYTDYTFGVWHGAELVPIAKAYSGLTNAEIEDLDRWIRAHTKEKFGTTRAVEPTRVFELAFEGIAASNRHKSGIALRFPRILRERLDKPASEADKLSDLEAVLRAASGAGA